MFVLQKIEKNSERKYALLAAMYQISIIRITQPLYDFEDHKQYMNNTECTFLIILLLQVVITMQDLANASFMSNR